MAESFNDLMDDRMTALQALTIVAIVYSKKIDSKFTADPSEFFGINDEVALALTDGTKAIQDVMQRMFRKQWDGKSPFWATIIEECREQCICDRAYAELALQENKLEWALKVLKNQSVNGGMCQNSIKKAREIVKNAYVLAVGSDEPAKIVVINESEIAKDAE